MTDASVAMLGNASSIFHAKVQMEMIRSLEKWGVQDIDPFKYSAILGEECGEVSRACIDAFNWKDGTWDKEKLMHAKTELIQVACVAIMFYQCLERDKWNQKS